MGEAINIKYAPGASQSKRALLTCHTNTYEFTNQSTRYVLFFSHDDVTDGAKTVHMACELSVERVDEPQGRGLALENTSTDRFG